MLFLPQATTKQNWLSVNGFESKSEEGGQGKC